MTVRVAILETIHENGIQAMQAFAQVDRLEGVSRAELLQRVGEYDAVVVKSNIQVDSEFLDAAMQLRVVARAGVGVDNFDQDVMAERNVRLFTTPTGNTISTAEFTVGLILNLVRRFPEIQNAVGRQDFRRHLYEGRELSQMTVGILGVGNTGMTVAKRLSAFGCRIMGCDRTMRRKTIFADLRGTMVEHLDAMLPEIDLLTLHVPSTPQTVGVVNASVFDQMKEGSFFVNTARGSVVNEADLLVALNSGQINAAALDVVDPEPPYDIHPDLSDFSHPLVDHQRVLYTPHIAASTEDAQRRMSLQIADKLREFLL